MTLSLQPPPNARHIPPSSALAVENRGLVFGEGSELPASTLAAYLGKWVRAVVVWCVDRCWVCCYADVAGAVDGGAAGQQAGQYGGSDHGAVSVASSLADLACM